MDSHHYYVDDDAPVSLYYDLIYWFLQSVSYLHTVLLDDLYTVISLYYSLHHGNSHAQYAYIYYITRDLSFSVYSDSHHDMYDILVYHHYYPHQYHYH